MDTKKLIEEVLLDLGNNKSLTDVSSKIQIIVRLLGDQKLKDWYRCEFVIGYKDEELPDYRISQAADIKANYIMPQGFGAWKVSGQSVPIANLGVDKYKQVMTVRMTDTVAAIIEYSKRPDSIAMSLNPYEHVLIQRVLGEAQIQSVHKELSPSTFQTIIDNVQGRIIDMFMDLNEKVFDGAIDINSATVRQEIHQVITNNITAGIFHSGNGDVNLTNSVVGKTASVTMTSTDLDAVKRCISDILSSKELEDNTDAQEEIAIIQSEVKKEKPSRRIIKKSLLFLKEVAVQTGASVCAQAIALALNIL